MLEPPITALIVDDEPLSRTRLRVLLEGEPDVVIVGECANGLQALDAISARQPELVFLDIQMPDLDGLGVLDALGCGEDDDTCPEFVFVTAYDRYWKRAFEIDAADYLEKPYSNARFQTALGHARRHVSARRQRREHQERQEQQASPAPASPAPARYPTTMATLRADRASVRPDGRVVVEDRSKATWHFILADTIDWIETAGHAQVRLHCGADTYLWRRSISGVEQELAPRGFLRVHRSYLVNAARIIAVKALHKGEYAIVLNGDTVIDTGRTYRDVVARFLDAA